MISKLEKMKKIQSELNFQKRKEKKMNEIFFIIMCIHQNVKRIKRKSNPRLKILPSKAFQNFV